ncbi:MAG: rod shape-determining protein [Lachnospiraceae bacterium]|nr:rod shape-determining protein [Lachnospiraceae bacterium]
MKPGKIPDNLVFGLDIGTRSIVGTVGYRKPTGQFVILAQKSKCHETRAMLDGQIHDIAKVAETVMYIKNLLEVELSVKLDQVCVAAAGRVLKTITVRMDYDLGDEMTVTKDMIFTMELMGMEQANAKLRSLERDGVSYYCVGYSIVKYYLGNAEFTNLEGHRGSSIGADVLATFLPMDVIDGLNAVCDKAGLHIVNLTLEPIAAMNIAIPENFRMLNLALVDIGAGTSDICITKGGSITGYGMLPCAGDFLTESIMYALLTDFATAEEIKLAYSSKQERITFKDVMGIEQTVEAAQIADILQEPFEKITGLIADKILELNGGNRVSAIFLVGGGGKDPGFAGLLAKMTGLPAQRVALRGEEVFTQIVSPDGKPVNDPMLVTPIGICLNYYEQNNNFIVVRMNGNDIKLYDNGKLNVMDAAVSIGMSNTDVFPKRGENLTFTVNGEEVIVRGKNGDSSEITVNGETAAITTAIKSRDIIELKPSTAGEKGSMKASGLEKLKGELNFIVNGREVGMPKYLLMNGQRQEADYSIKEGDSLIIPDYYPLGELLEKLNVNEGISVIINNREIDMEAYDPEEKIYEHYIIELKLKEASGLKNIVKDVRDVVESTDDSDGETVIDERDWQEGESYEDYLDRRYGRNQYRSVKHDDPYAEIEEEGREGYGRFGSMSGLEINAIIGNSGLSAGMEAAIDDFGRALSKEARARERAAGKNAAKMPAASAYTGSATDKSVNDELIKKLQEELAALTARQEQRRKKNGAAGVSGLSGIGSSGLSGLSGLSGIGSTGLSGVSGLSGIGSSGLSGLSGIGSSGLSGLSGLGAGLASTGLSAEGEKEPSASADNESKALADGGQEQPAEPVVKENQSVTCYVNGDEIVMDNKPEYIFVDLLDHYSFDTTAAHGNNVIMKVNGVSADFFTPIKQGDRIDLFWQ